MELFKINCVTCQASLSVRNESLIGQIVACPRCGSMVEVASPAPTEPAPTIAPPHEAELPEVPATEHTVAEVPQQAEQPEAPSTGPAAPIVNKLYAGVAASVLVGTTLIGWTLLQSDDATDQVATNTPIQLAPTSPAKPTEVPQVETPVLPPQASNVELAPEQPTPGTKTQPPTPESDRPQDKPLPPQELAPVTPTAPTETQPEPPPASTAAPKLARRFDPLDFDPENLSLNTIDQAASPENTNADSIPADDPIDSPEEIAEPAHSTTPAVHLGPKVDAAISQLEAEKQLSLVFPALKFERLPLHECLRLFSQMSGTPVSVAPEQLLMAGVTPNTEVSLAASDLSLGKMLEQVLQPLRLEYVARGSQVVISRRDAQKVREIKYPIDDLVSDQTDAATIAAWIEQLVAPNSWQSRGGQGTLEQQSDSLIIQQPQQVQYQVLILLEQLRLARNVPLRSRFPVKRLTGIPATARLHEQLATSTTFTFSQFTALHEVISFWQIELGVPILVDWPALSALELYPASTISCAIQNEPWQAAFEQILEPLGLGWRAVSGGAIEITTAEEVQSQFQLELYPLHRNRGITAQQLLPRLSKLTSLDSGTLLYDPAGDVLLSYLPATLQRVVFEELLKQELLRTK